MLRLHIARDAQLVALSVALLVTSCVCVSISNAQTPSLDQEKPVESLHRANPSSDQDLVTLATKLMDARADTDISFHEYRQGVRFFRKYHPGFYGNFFGNPFFATYDIRYEQLAQKRTLANIEVNPQNNVRNPQGFFCNPEGYDPAFGGWCRGWSFLASDFFRLPDTFGSLSLSSHEWRTLPRIVAHVTNTSSSWHENNPVSASTETPVHPLEEKPSSERTRPLPSRDEGARPSPVTVESAPPARVEGEATDLESVVRSRLARISSEEIANRVRHAEDAGQNARQNTRAETRATLERIVEEKLEGRSLSARERAQIVSGLERITSSPGGIERSEVGHDRRRTRAVDGRQSRSAHDRGDHDRELSQPTRTREREDSNGHSSRRTTIRTSQSDSGDSGRNRSRSRSDGSDSDN